MHAEERERLILDALGRTGFVTYRALESGLPVSPATIRRDLARLEDLGRISRVRGGARIADLQSTRSPIEPFLEASIDEAKRDRDLRAEAIAESAAALCSPGEGMMMDGDDITLRMCRHIDGFDLQVLTNSLPVVNALLPYPSTRVLVPAGSLLRQQGLIMAAEGEDGMPRFHAPRLFMGAGSIGQNGVMQSDMVVVAAQRRLIERAQELVLLVESDRFASPSGMVVCGLEEIDVVITDEGISDPDARMIEGAGARLIISKGQEPNELK